MARRLVTPKGKAVQITGLVELQKRISDILDRTTGPEVKKVHMKAALVLRDEIRNRAPLIKSDPKNPKKWQLPGVIKAATFAAFGRNNTPDVLVGVNQRLAPQAHWVEYGTAIRTTKSGANRGQVSPQPFFRPGLTAKRAECVGIIAEGYRELIEKAAR